MISDLLCFDMGVSRNEFNGKDDQSGRKNVWYEKEVFPASRENVFEKIQKLETLQYIARPFATFYSWVFQWGGKVRIEGPEAAVTEYKEMAREALEG